MKKLEPYLFANGRADEMIGFYQQALDAEVQIRMTFGESPEPSPMPLPTGWDAKVMHATLKVGDAQLMISDGDTDKPANHTGFRISLGLDSQDDVRRAFEALSAGGSVQLPLSQTFWSPLFGMATDKFGIGWMIGVNA
ncbi:MAG: VOC family protein [Xanthomonadales bacterium]|nr:VOC family protein [Xanthomonadales bacterium]